MSLTVQLLGAPQVRHDGVPVEARRGQKAWGVLTYLLLHGSPVTRSALCSLFFEEAEDPRAALRWNLSALRQLVGDRPGLSQDPVHLPLVDGDQVDVLHAPASTWRGELLETMSFPSAPAFEVWLEAQRARLRGVRVQRLHRAALEALAQGCPEDAAALAADLVVLAPLEEIHHALLVRALAAAGDGVAAARRVAACRDLFRRELGVQPGAELDAAAAVTRGRPIASPRPGSTAVESQVVAGEAAVAAGAIDAGIECLRRAVADAGEQQEPAARALLALGTTLVHAVRGHDEEGATALHRVVAAGQHSRPDLAGAACAELGYIEFLRGHLAAVEPWLTRAEDLCDDPEVRAQVAVVRGCTLSDSGQYASALAVLSCVPAWTEDLRRRTYALSMVGRVHLLSGDTAQAREALELSLDGALRSAWRSFTPWPESLLAEVDLAEDRVEDAKRRSDAAFGTSCQLGDPCWEGVSARGRGRVLHRLGAHEEAVSTLWDARRRSSRLPDGYRWVDAWTLEALCQVMTDPDAGRALAVELTDIAASTGMQHLLALGLRHRARWGEPACAGYADQLLAAMGSPSAS